MFDHIQGKRLGGVVVALPYLLPCFLPGQGINWLFTPFDKLRERKQPVSVNKTKLAVNLEGNFNNHDIRLVFEAVTK